MTSATPLTQIYFLFGEPRIQISARKPTILTEVFRDFPQSLQANARIVP